MNALRRVVLASSLILVASASVVAAPRPQRPVVRPRPVAPATPEPAPVAPAPVTVDSSRYASDEAIRRYLSARLLEEEGQLSEALGEHGV